MQPTGRPFPSSLLPRRYLRAWPGKAQSASMLARPSRPLARVDGRGKLPLGWVMAQPSGALALGPGIMKRRDGRHDGGSVSQILGAPVFPDGAGRGRQWLWSATTVVVGVGGAAVVDARPTSAEEGGEACQRVVLCGGR
jgi:hypothetical protein